jgi:hypothetical protein
MSCFDRSPIVYNVTITKICAGGKCYHIDRSREITKRNELQTNYLCNLYFFDVLVWMYCIHFVTHKKCCKK